MKIHFRTVLLCCLMSAAGGSCLFAQQPDVIPAGYRVETIGIPDGAHFGVAGLDVSPNGDVYAGTRYGEVWRYRNGEWTLFAEGLSEIAGLNANIREGGILAAHKPELTFLADTDGDGAADLFECVCDEWGFSGNYHEFAFGPVADSAGNLYGTLNLSHGQGPAVGGGIMTIGAKGRGTCWKLSPDGVYSTYAWGLRSPAGIGINPGTDELFYTDNQGDWNASSSLHHVREGGFYGHPASLLYHPDYADVDLNGLTPAEYDRLRSRPAVWIPHGELASSPGNPVFNQTGGAFGPFEGQIFIGDQTRSNIFRCLLDDVGGEYQGACVEFINHLQSGSVRLAFAPDGALWVGQTSRGWGSVGTVPFGVQRVAWDGVTIPFEVEAVKLTSDGFAVTFTRPLNREIPAAETIAQISHWGYEYSGQYGSPKVDETTVPVTAVSVTDDRRTMVLTLPELATRRVYRITLPETLQSDEGRSLANRRIWYTLNRLVDAEVSGTD